MNIGWSTWEPGLVSPKPTSAGGAAWTSYLFDTFRHNGHNVVMMQGSAAGVHTVIDDADLLGLDVAVFCWRWPMPEYPERQRAYERQMQLIHMLGRAKIPMLIHNQDHKMTASDRELVKEYDGVIAAPQFVLEGEHRADMTLFFPNPYWRGQYQFWGVRPTTFAYVGNNYERFEQVVAYIQQFSAYYKTDFYGNWMEPGPGRESPEYVRAVLPHVNFHGRLPQDRVIETLSQADTTMHFAKDSYLRHGFITLRWAEAAAANTIAFVPYDMHLPSEYYRLYSRYGLTPRDSSELMEAIEWIRREQTWPEILDLQWRFVQEFMGVEQWLETIEHITNNRRTK
jgi:hypothetical protein